jgi:predicted HTH transcriptional regulator
MKIFNQLDIVDHTGHGIPIIVEKHGKEAFEISDNYIMVAISFDNDVMATLNVGINDVEKLILEELLKNPQLTSAELSATMIKSKRTIERYIKALQGKDYLERVGSNKTGYWDVIKWEI